MRLLKVLLLFLLPCLSFAQLKLRDALAIATKNSLLLKDQNLNIPIADNDVKKARLYNNPIFNLQYMQLLPRSNQYNQGKGVLHPTNSQDWFQLTKRFQVFGQRIHRIEMAKLDASIVRYQFDETKRDLALEVAMEWIDAWRALAYRNLAMKAANYLDSYLRSTKDNSLRTMKADEKLRFEILDDQYDLQLGQAEQEYFTTTEKLKLLLGIRDSILIDINDTLETVIIGSSIDSLFLLAKQNRADVKMFDAFKKGSLTNVKYQKSLAIPQPEAGFIWNPQNGIPYAGLYFTQQLPLFDRNHTEVQKAKLSSQSYEIKSQQNMNELTSEISASFYNYNRSKTLVKGFRHNLEDSEKLLVMVKKAYLNNERSLVDIWEAEQTWVQTYSMYYDAYVDYRKSYINVLYQLNLLD